MAKSNAKVEPLVIEQAPAAPTVVKDPVLGDLDAAMKEFGLTRATTVKKTHEFFPFLVKVAKQIDTIRKSSLWGTMHMSERHGLAAVRVFIRQLIGEAVPQHEFATLADMFDKARSTGGVLGDVSNITLPRPTAESMLKDGIV